MISNVVPSRSGWDYWFELPGWSTHDATGFTVSENGTLIHFGPEVNDSAASVSRARNRKEAGVFGVCDLDAA